MVESLMIILGYNSGLCCRRFVPRFEPPWNEVLEGVVPERGAVRVQDYPGRMVYEPDVPLRLRDPFGVEGVWSRVSPPSTYLHYSSSHLRN
jgi:hypothetical protein